jgi:N-acetylneuraminic acid mutarotase
MRTIINLCSPLSLLLLCLTIGPLSVSRADPAVRGAWTLTGNMHDARQEHTATLLLDGRVLVTGGNVGAISLSSAELYDPNTGNWSLTGSLHEGRQTHTATLLGDGRVLVAGGFTYDSPQRVLKSAELYDPATGIWSQTGDMAVAREFYTATLLPSGKVLVVGGGGGVRYHHAEIYDPDTGTWSFTGALAQPIAFQTATLLQGGEVLIAGGVLGSGDVSRFAVLYDVATALWNKTDNLARRYLHTATLLADGTLLVAGGFNYSLQYHTLRNAELYDPISATWSMTDSMHDARCSHTETLLPSGKVLVAGGGEVTPNGTTWLISSEVYDPIGQIWSRNGHLNVARALNTATLLPNGKVLSAGGGNENGILASAEVFDPNASQ